jgi:hypothetical protein
VVVCRVADDGHVVAVFHVEQGAGGFAWANRAGIFLFTKWMTCALMARDAKAGRWLLGLLFAPTP